MMGYISISDGPYLLALSSSVHLEIQVCRHFSIPQAICFLFLIMQKEE